MEIGVRSILYHKINLYKSIEKVSKDFKIIELWTEPGHLFPREIKQKKIRELKELLDSLKLKRTMHATWGDINLSSFNSGIRNESIKQIKECIKFSHDIGAEIVTVHPGEDTYSDIPKRYALIELIKSLNEILDFAKKFNVFICLENSPNKDKKVLKTTGDFKFLFRKINSELLNMTFDFVHADSVSEVMNFINQLNSKIKHIHIADNDGSVHNPLPIGSGRIGFEESFKILKKSKFDGYIIIEEIGNERTILEEKRKIINIWNKI